MQDLRLRLSSKEAEVKKLRAACDLSVKEAIGEIVMNTKVI